MALLREATVWIDCAADYTKSFGNSLLPNYRLLLNYSRLHKQ